ncbi:helix-turn-helix domain-containing protein [Sphaerisporangium sp. NPDC051011]|uniref:TetR/AcrR family transcriptional regulator n=1 Tax=Sphaerisporangium sp. NPDC051011 TaxID=3155792 RepID=UPI0033CF8D8C
MNREANVNRPYRSDLRQEGARATRFAIIRAAQDLFARDGYGGTSIDAIARQAGVARATIFNSVGGKPALMRAAYHAAVVGGDDPRHPREGPLGERARQAATPEEVLHVYAEVLAEVFEAVSSIHSALVTASSDSDELRAMLDELDSGRYVGAANIVDLLLERGDLAPGMTKERAADILWVFNDPRLWHALHRERAWDRSEFTDWLSGTLKSQLLPADQGAKDASSSR